MHVHVYIHIHIHIRIRMYIYRPPITASWREHAERSRTPSHSQINASTTTRSSPNSRACRRTSAAIRLSVTNFSTTCTNGRRGGCLYTFSIASQPPPPLPPPLTPATPSPLTLRRETKRAQVSRVAVAALLCTNSRRSVRMRRMSSESCLPSLSSSWRSWIAHRVSRAFSCFFTRSAAAEDSAVAASRCCAARRCRCLVSFSSSFSRSKCAVSRSCCACCAAVRTYYMRTVT